MNVWEAITGNSELEIQAGTTFFDHLMNPKAGDTTIIRQSGDILAIIDQDYVKFGNDSKTATSQNNQGTITRQAGDRSLTAKGEGRTLTATTAGKTGTFKSGKRKVTVK